MKKKNLYLLSEITNREFESKVLLALEASNFNIRTFVLDRNFFLENIKKFKPGLVLYKSVVETDEKIIDLIKKYGHKFFCLDEEGIFTQKQTYDLKFRFGQKCLDKLDHMFFLNNYWLNLLKKNYKIQKKKFSVSGYPRVEFMKYLSLNKDPISHNIKKKYGNFVFVPTSFPSNNFFGKNGFVKSISSNFHKGMNQKQKQYISQHLDFYNHYQNLYKDMLINLISENKNLTFVIRPHPTENSDFWKKDLIDLTNVYFDQNYATGYWVKSSLCTLQFFSTITIEAFHMNKPMIEYMPSMPKRFKNKILMDYHRSFIFRFSKYKDLNKFIKKIYKEKTINIRRIIKNKKNQTYLSTKIKRPSTQILKTIDSFNVIKTDKIYLNEFNFSKNQIYRFLFWFFAHIGLLYLLPQKFLKGKFSVLRREYIRIHKNYYKYKKKKFEKIEDERFNLVFNICKKGLNIKKKIDYNRITGNNFVFFE